MANQCSGESVLTAQAKDFLEALHHAFNPTIKKLLEARQERQIEISAGSRPDFLPQTSDIRAGDWQVAAVPADLSDRRVEITGPVERKMMINALNSGAKVFMADFEDSLSPTWQNIIDGQINCIDAVRGTLSFTSPEGKSYSLKQSSELATLVVRPRGWHLSEKNFLVGGEPISASLFDFGLYFFHNHAALINRGTAPYFYLPKLESHLEARLWNQVFNFAQDRLSVERGTIKATVLIETILAAFEMEEILFELKEHIVALNAGRWDYIFSMIKKFSSREDFPALPDRAQVTMAVPFMSAYAKLLVATCHKRGAHAIGGMAAFIPSRKDEKVNEIAFAKVREDKTREASLGFDGTWVAHPDLVPVAKAVFDNTLGSSPNQTDVLHPELVVSASDLLNTTIDGGKITKAGVAANIDVALQYIESWLSGTGAAAIHNLMEDAATAEISRAQIWQYIKSGAKTDDGETITVALYKELRHAALEELAINNNGKAAGKRFAEAAEILDQIILTDQFVEFLTIPAYSYI
ncbi:MAG: malate synthase A [Candidatus Obscuribacterales bacterium]